MRGRRSAVPTDSFECTLLPPCHRAHLDWCRCTAEHDSLGDWNNAVLVGDEAKDRMAIRGKTNGRCPEVATRSRPASVSFTLGPLGPASVVVGAQSALMPATKPLLEIPARRAAAVPPRTDGHTLGARPQTLDR
jgi:hypothetical protein